jgi:hypothetical protein
MYIFALHYVAADTVNEIDSIYTLLTSEVTAKHSNKERLEQQAR